MLSNSPEPKIFHFNIIQNKVNLDGVVSHINPNSS